MSSDFEPTINTKCFSNSWQQIVLKQKPIAHGRARTESIDFYLFSRMISKSSKIQWMSFRSLFVIHSFRSSFFLSSVLSYSSVLHCHPSQTLSRKRDGYTKWRKIRLNWYMVNSFESLSSPSDLLCARLATMQFYQKVTDLLK